jgi:hypothetical protein
MGLDIVESVALSDVTIASRACGALIDRLKNALTADLQAICRTLARIKSEIAD